MKRFLALAALILGMVSCQTEPEGLDVIVGGEVDTYITVALPEAETRADADWNFSKEGAFKNVVGSDAYTIRYIFDVYYGTARAERQVKYSDDKSVAFGVRLVPEREYSFVVWADVVAETDREENAWSNDDNAYYDTEHLHAITLKDTWNAMDEKRDAFTGVHTETNYTGSSNITISLTRPFAKLRVVTTDFDELAKFGIEAKYATVEYTTPYVSEFNALEGKAVAAAENGPKMTHEYTIKSYADETGDEHTIFSDYIFTTHPAGVVKFNMEVFEDAAMTKRIKANSFNTDIQVRPNYITTLKGDVLTTGGNVTITVNPGFAQDEIVENYVDTAEDLQDVIDNATDGQETVVVLGGDVDLSELAAGISSTRAAEPAFGLEIPAGKVVTLDLKGYTISQTKEQTAAYAMILNKGTLTIKDSSANGTGKLSYADSGQGGEYASNTVKNDGVMIIDGGTIENNSSETVAATGYPHPVDNNGVLTINGGTLTNNAHYSSMRIWCTTDDNTIVTINGGTFNGSIDFQTPSAAANKGTLTITGGTFNADTYTKTAVRLLGFGADVDEMNGYIEGGVFNGAIALKKYVSGEFNSKVFDITGGTFTADPSEFVNDDYTVVEANGVYTLEQKPVIVKIGNTEYRTLNKAVAAANEGETIVFVADVEQEDGVIITDKNITIDLNDKTFTVSNGANTNNRNFKVNGSSVVTIMNGTMVAAGEYSSGAYGTLRTEGTANVTLNDVKLYNYRGNGFNVKACAGTNVTITDAEVYSQYGGGVEAAGGIVELNDVKIDQKGMYTAPYNSMAVSVNGGGTVTVNSGTYSTECITAEEAYNQGTSHGPWCAGVMNSGGTLIIKGGTFSNDNFGDNALATYARGLLLADTGANIQIEGGVFNAVKAIIDMTNNLGDASKNPSATISGGNFSADPQVSGLYASHLIKVAEGYKVVENNGRWTVVVDPAAKIGDVEYKTLEAAVAAAEEGATITLLKDVTLAEELALPAGVTFNGNGKQINGSIYAEGNLTFVGHTKVTTFSASYYNRTITVGEGACLEVTGTGRVTLGYGNTFNITGSIDNAKSADKANIKPSLIIPGGISITGGNDATMNVTNAYISLGNTSSKNNSANGVFTLNFTNSIVDFTNQFTLSAPTGGKTPTFNVNITNSVLTTDTKLCLAAPASNVVVDNSILNLKTYFRNSGKFDLKNGSVMTGATIQFGENGGNDGAITVDNSTLTITATTGHAFEGQGVGSITASNGATVNVTYYKAMAIYVDETSTFTGTEVK